MKKIFSILAISLMFVNLNYGQNMKLVVGDQIKIKGGTPGLNKILISDANGLANWTSLDYLKSVGSFTTTTCTTANYIPKMIDETEMDCSIIYDDGLNNVVIGSEDENTHDVSGNLIIMDRVGIGTAPADDDIALKLHIKNWTETYPQGGDPTSAKLRIEDATWGYTSRDAWWDFTASAGNHNFSITSNYGDASHIVNIMTFTETGNVGIGTTTPTAKLEVTDVANSFVAKFQGGSTNLLALGTYANVPVIQAQNIAGTVPQPLTINPQGGKVDIGGTDLTQYTSQDYDLFKLFVNGKILCEKVKVIADVLVPDYVFDENYNLTSLKDIEDFIAKNKHLPEVPSADEMKTNGIDLTDMNILLLKKVEELTLHLIEQNKQIEELMKANEIFKEKFGMK